MRNKCPSSLLQSVLLLFMKLSLNSEYQGTISFFLKFFIVWLTFVCTPLPQQKTVFISYAAEFLFLIKMQQAKKS